MYKRTEWGQSESRKREGEKKGTKLQCSRCLWNLDNVKDSREVGKKGRALSRLGGTLIGGGNSSVKYRPGVTRAQLGIYHSRLLTAVGGAPLFHGLSP